MLIEPQRSIWDDYIFLSYIHRSLCKYRNECENFVEIIAIHTTICFSFRSTIVCVCVWQRRMRRKKSITLRRVKICSISMMNKAIHIVLKQCCTIVWWKLLRKWFRQPKLVHVNSIECLLVEKQKKSNKTLPSLHIQLKLMHSTIFLSLVGTL